MSPVLVRLADIQLLNIHVLDESRYLAYSIQVSSVTPIVVLGWPTFVPGMWRLPK